MNQSTLPVPSAKKLPRWRGFNLLEKFIADRQAQYRESDYVMLAEWGFDFVRLPMSYRCWSQPPDWLKMDEKKLGEVDAAVALGKQYNIHVNLNLHRAPGYCVNPPAEPKSLWTDPEALDACAFHWAHLAKRYKGIDNAHVSFDLLNEPPDIQPEVYHRVVERLVHAIRQEDPDRLIIADGLKWGRLAVPSLRSLAIGQSTRGYDPMHVSHYQARWVEGADKYPVPTWPMEIDGKRWGKQQLHDTYIAPWVEMERLGVGVHVGEAGAYRWTPHDVTLAWLHDWLTLWKSVGWGWALWNFRGDFGPLDSQRADVKYESYRGSLLDRKMLELLRSY